MNMTILTFGGLLFIAILFYILSKKKEKDKHNKRDQLNDEVDWDKAYNSTEIDDQILEIAKLCKTEEEFFCFIERKYGEDISVAFLVKKRLMKENKDLYEKRSYNAINTRAKLDIKMSVVGFSLHGAHRKQTPIGFSFLVENKNENNESIVIENN